ncbi:nucleoside hydrolase [Thalassobaculum litoreum]|uniref:Purine nucleosidase n=1 Tax=Thalassobaculum litoreum DSM 18839 TaxID=1123362 RepID=A0A8G2F2W2_9PROT|nr:nucleoside hydrolase [Thalassobaculum litoreum]SDF67855.1 purine nucleosidase [Thalassobaculum litoreum DSM 18839]
MTPPPSAPHAMPAAAPTDIVIDCDPGIDDAIAILLAAACPQQVRISALTATHGNVGLALTARNACRLRSLAGLPEVPVHAGCPRPLTAPVHDAAHIHGGNGLGGVELADGDDGHAEGRGGHAEGRGGLAEAHGVDALIAEAQRGRTLVAVGPLTNVAVTLIKRPETAARWRRLVIMGGGVEKGNVTPQAEFNVFTDPEAARTVLTTTEWPVAARPVLFPLDTTHQALLSPDWIADLAATGGKVCRIAAAMLGGYDTPSTAAQGGKAVHDAMAVAWTIRPELFETRAARIDVVTDSGAARGRTVADFVSIEPTADIVTGVDAPAFIQWLKERLASLDAALSGG